jgi:hypothetical protein
MGIMQEKFQINLPSNGNDNASSGWVSDKSARVKKNIPGREGRAGGDFESKRMNNATFFNSLPPGSNIIDQEMADIRKMELVMSGESDVSMDYNMGAVKKGYTKRQMSPTDDMYTNEHNDAFYGECIVDGETGFLERNNMLDRL